MGGSSNAQEAKLLSQQPVTLFMHTSSNATPTLCVSVCVCPCVAEICALPAIPFLSVDLFANFTMLVLGRSTLLCRAYFV